LAISAKALGRDMEQRRRAADVAEGDLGLGHRAGGEHRPQHSRAGSSGYGFQHSHRFLPLWFLSNVIRLVTRAMGPNSVTAPSALAVSGLWIHYGLNYAGCAHQGCMDRDLMAGRSGLEERLGRALEGEVRFDPFARARYATDASHYQVMPVGVATPRHAADMAAALAIARDAGVSVLARGGGTSQCGQTVNDSLVLDTTPHFNRILEIDAANRRCVVEPGIVLDELNRALKPHGLWFPVDVSTASRATLGGMAGNNSCGTRSIRYGIMRDHVLAIDALLADGSEVHFGPVERANADGLFGDCWRSAHARRMRSPRNSRRSCAGSAATISTRWCRTGRATISPTCWSARKARWRSPPNWS
jgi:hypothetical protein